MGEEIAVDNMESRRERVLQAFHILVGDKASLLTDEENAIIGEYRALRNFGFGRMEVIVVAHRMEGVNWTQHKKRKDLINTP